MKFAYDNREKVGEGLEKFRDGVAEFQGMMRDMQGEMSGIADDVSGSFDGTEVDIRAGSTQKVYRKRRRDDNDESGLDEVDGMLTDMGRGLED